MVKVCDQLWAPPLRQRRPADRGPESKSPPSELTLWQEPTTEDGTFQVTVSLTWIVTEGGR
jgi:hypothetical protein